MDVQTINQTTKLSDLLGNLKPSGRYHIGPCPFCGGRDRFNVKPTDSGDLWICRQCGDGRYQDAAAFLMKRDGLTFAELLAANGGQPGQRPLPRRAQPVTAVDEPPGEDWQSAALVAINDCCHTLHGRKTPEAAGAYDYLLTHRGLTAETIFNASLGYNAAWREIAPDCWLAPGITIPAMMGGHLWYVNVRTTKAARLAASGRGRDLDKYHAMTGSKLKSLYRANTLLTAHTAVVVEGEFDALLLGQFLPDGVTAVTMGSAGSLPDNPAWLRYFAAVERVYLVMDNDAAGQQGLGKWQKLLSWVEPLAVPGGHNDMTDFWRAGGDVKAWLKDDLSM